MGDLVVGGKHQDVGSPEQIVDGLRADPAEHVDGVADAQVGDQRSRSVDLAVTGDGQVRAAGDREAAQARTRSNVPLRSPTRPRKSTRGGPSGRCDGLRA